MLYTHLGSLFSLKCWLWLSNSTNEIRKCIQTMNWIFVCQKLPISQHRHYMCVVLIWNGKNHGFLKHTLNERLPCFMKIIGFRTEHTFLSSVHGFLVFNKLTLFMHHLAQTASIFVRWNILQISVHINGLSSTKWIFTFLWPFTSNKAIKYLFAQKQKCIPSLFLLFLFLYCSFLSL